MAKPRIFISSTFFDLRQVRADLERFIKEMGYESVRNETGSIPYGKDSKLEEYCYREISGIDILVGIIGGRFGSESQKDNYSVTQAEIKTALEQNKNVYLFIDKNVHSEYETYLINKKSKDIHYRYADDIRIYQFIEELYALPKNNVIFSFETVQDIIQFLREQWAGLLKDLLNQEQKRKEVESLSNKVNELNEVASTLQRYLENVLESVNKDSSVELIKQENKRLKEYHKSQQIRRLTYIDHLIDSHDLTLNEIVDTIKNSTSLSQIKHKLNEQSELRNGDEDGSYNCMFDFESLEDINLARELLEMPPIEITEEEKEQIESRADIDTILKRKFDTERKKLSPTMYKRNSGRSSNKGS